MSRDRTLTRSWKMCLKDSLIRLEIHSTYFIKTAITTNCHSQYCLFDRANSKQELIEEEFRYSILPFLFFFSILLVLCNIHIYTYMYLIHKFYTFIVIPLRWQIERYFLTMICEWRGGILINNKRNFAYARSVSRYLIFLCPLKLSMYFLIFTATFLSCHRPRSRSHQSLVLNDTKMRYLFSRCKHRRNDELNLLKVKLRSWGIFSESKY